LKPQKQTPKKLFTNILVLDSPRPIKPQNLTSKKILQAVFYRVYNTCPSKVYVVNAAPPNFQTGELQKKTRPHPIICASKSNIRYGGTLYKYVIADPPKADEAKPATSKILNPRFTRVSFPPHILPMSPKKPKKGLKFEFVKNTNEAPKMTLNTKHT